MPALRWSNLAIQKQPSRDVLRKRCSKNMQQIYRRISMPKCDFSKVALQLYWNRTSAWMFSLNLLYIFRTLFYKNISGWLLLAISRSWSTQSQTLKSCVNTAPVWSLFYKVLHLFFIIVIKACCALEFLQNADWNLEKNLLG